MPKIKLCLDIDIDNYKEAVKLYASQKNMPIELITAMMPEAAIKSAVDQKITEKIKIRLGEFVAAEVQKELAEHGVSATIRHSYE